jgi:hypothetical protein
MINGRNTDKSIPEAAGVFNAGARMTDELADSVRQYHFYSKEDYQKSSFSIETDNSIPFNVYGKF